LPRRQRRFLGADELDVVADRGYFNSTEILACAQADITVTLPKPMTSGAKSEGRFGKQDFVYLPTEDVYRCPAGQKLRIGWGLVIGVLDQHAHFAPNALQAEMPAVLANREKSTRRRHCVANSVFRGGERENFAPLVRGERSFT
jgi:hypothetical protein